MQLWKKNFFFVCLLLQVVLFTGLLVFVNTNFQTELKQEITKFSTLRRDSLFLIEKIVEEPTSEFSQRFAKMISKQQGYYFAIEQEGKLLFSSIPTTASYEPKFEINHLSLKKVGNKSYLSFVEPGYFNEQGALIYYLKDSSQLYYNQKKRLVLSYLTGIMLSLSLSLIIYWQMKKIYRPIENLSHELRTPLTLISGYSELLSRVKTTEEEKITISQDIYTQALQLQGTVEQLLIMGDLKAGTISKEKLQVSSLVKKLQTKYPLLQVEFKNEGIINGNPVLLIRLLDNLLENAIQASQTCSLVIEGTELLLTNAGKTLAESQLRKMNRGKKLLPSEYHGSGQGFIICREIVQLHQGSIEITSSNEEIAVRIRFECK